MSFASQIFANPDLHAGALRRVEQWYRIGQSAPQPEWADFSLNQDERLAQLGEELSKELYEPQPMHLLPYPKSKQRLRHFCEPSVKDQVAFTIFATALAPFLEHGMKNLSFGNRWYRGVTWNEDSYNGRWEPMRWSLADSQMYQPYRRGHGLFRRVASWTVDAMLGAQNTGSAGKYVSQEGYDASLIPRFAKSLTWKGNHCEKVYWARFDLKLAFPSVRIDSLRLRLRKFVSDLLTPPESKDVMQQFSLNLSEERLERSLQLFPAEIVSVLRDADSCSALCDQLISCLEKVRYVGFKDSDHLFFEGKFDEHYLLPTSANPKHVGLPTGLAISPLLLNVYLHGLDDRMHRWCRQGNGGFLRFVDDIILMAPSADKLAEGIDEILTELQVLDLPKSELNLRINPSKVEPNSVAQLVEDMLPTGYTRAAKTARQCLSEIGSARRTALDNHALTIEMRNPFVTNLVERMSELGTEDELDALPERAKDRINRLAEMVYLEPKADAVPRATQVVFAANQLVRGWLSEESPAQDRRELQEIRQVVATALRSAPEKPRLWRAVIRAALRRPTGLRSYDDLTADDAGATYWLINLARHFGPDSDGTWHSEELAEKPCSIWPYFTSYHRNEVWRTLAATSQELHAALAHLKGEVESFPSSRSWLFRAGDETDLENAPRWLESAALKLATLWYGSGMESDAPHSWEIDSLALCALSFTPRLTCAASKDFGRSEDPFGATVAKLLRESSMSEWLGVADLLESRSASERKSSAVKLTCILLAAVQAKDEKSIVQALGNRLERRLLLRLAETASLDHSESDVLLKAAEDEMREFNKMPPADRTMVVKRDYGRARRIYLNMGGSLL